METLFEFSPLAVAAVPIVLGLVQLIKITGLPTRFLPTVSVLVGIALVALIPELSWQTTIVQGIIAGLVASGLWSGSKATAGY